MKLILLLIAILALTASAYEEIRCKTSAKNFKVAHRVISGKLKPELVLESICKSSKDGCGDITGAVRAMKSIAAQRVFCDVTDPENLESKYARMLPGAHNSTSLTFYDDDYGSGGSDDGGSSGGGGSDDGSSGGGGDTCSYSCGSQCTDDAVFSCIKQCADAVADCSKVEDIVSIPSCIEGAASCLEDLTGACCTCPCRFHIYCCKDCNF